MRQASKRIPDGAEKTVRDIRRNTRRHHSPEEKVLKRGSASRRSGEWSDDDYDVLAYSVVVGAS